MGITIGILAHVDAGKTTLAEQLLFHAGLLRTPGQVDRQNTLLDHDSIEQRRGITVFSDQASFVYEGERYHLIDTPGHVDFSGEMERSLSIMDCAILVISCVEGIQSHTEMVWRLLQKNSIPVFLFLNKTDRVGANPEGLLREIRRKWKIHCFDFTTYAQNGEMPLTQAEQLAELDDSLLEHYFSTGYDDLLWRKAAASLVEKREVFPAFCGSALNDDGVGDFLKLLSWLTPRCKGKKDAPFSAQAYKVRHDRRGGRIVFLKIKEGVLHPKEEILCPSGDGELVWEKVNEVRLCQGARFQPLLEAEPGDICAVTGIRTLKPGWEAGEEAARSTPFTIQPLLSARVLWEESLYSAQTLLGYLRELEDEEPLLNVLWEEEVQQIRLHVMGEIQLEVLSELVQERYGVAIRFGECEILYRETIADSVIGCGHFEPLRHYAEVHLRISPGKRGSGVVFDSECPTDELAANWQNLIGTHVLEKEHRGVLTGMPLTDVRITLLAGRAHLKHTEGGDFREATYRAIRQGLMRAESILLEPYYRFELEADISLAGRLFADIQKMSGTADPPENSGELIRICGRAPAAEIGGYAKELAAFSKGKGKLALLFDGYDICHNTEEVIKRRNYQPEHDVANPADSVFCSHGAGFPVKWQDAPAYMHIKR